MSHLNVEIKARCADPEYLRVRPADLLERSYSDMLLEAPART